ncbi:uncharacterized protein LOC115435551 isoform X4 [Sphaeramia orbicularis]|uniref:uncharacterized protein LOC115435551 isoform X4 n=1 Tax=Sphaeramia orbicularis TaxID=375764 RepID=UPI00117F9C83|nr:uncharacterized protein LOC115435551 isoform X4 [Sphaeramia orbicularis]
MISFLYLGLIFFTQVKAGLRSSDDLVMFASPGGSVTLPCAIKSIESCSSINWDRAEQGWISWYGPMTKVVRAGTVTAAKAHKYRLLNNCSLQINNMATDDARVYTCDNKKLNSTVALSILQPLRSLAWLALPVGILVCITVGGIYVYMKRKHNKDADNEQADIGMTHVYEDVQDIDNEELQRQSPLRRSPATTDSFYDLLQAVN